jgi:putative component of toxin-antitoxin plasmid stabilization module
MIEVRQTEGFSGWLRRLRDANAVARIVGRNRRMETGIPGEPRIWQRRRQFPCACVAIA